ncbi:hypothetical protein ACWEOO_32410 [Kribbella sp. NPDC004138]
MSDDSGQFAVRKFYDSLAAHDPGALRDAVHEDFVLTLSPGLPLPVDREFRGRETRCWPELMAAS